MNKLSHKNEWIPVIVDYLYITNNKIKNVFAHAKVIHGHLEDDYKYYEIMIPSHDFFTCYIDKNKIKEFLWILNY